MSEETDSQEERFPCDTCGASVTPFGDSGDQIQQLLNHLTNYNDPHHTLQLIPKTYFGSVAPTVGDGYKEGDAYVDVSGQATYVYRKTAENPVAYQWVRGTPNVSAHLAPYVFVDPVEGVYPERNLTTILSAYLTASAAASAYATKTALNALASTVSNLSATTGTYVYRNGGSSAQRNLDTILSAYVKAADIASYLTGKQDMLTAGTGVSISDTGVISVSIPGISVATSSTAGLMSASDKTYLDSLSGVLSGFQPKLTSSNAGTGVSISSTGVISVSTYGVATQSANGLMSKEDKAKLDSISTGGSGYSLPAATYSALGGMKVSSATVADIVNSAYSAPAGYTQLFIGQSGFGYAKDPVIANGTVAGVVKVDGTRLSVTTGYYKCKMDTNGFIYYGTSASTKATGITLGAVMVDPTILVDTTGYAACRIDEDGRIYYGTASVSPASASTLGGVLVDGTHLTLGTVGDWAKIRTDADGFAYYRENIASYDYLGHVKVSETVLEDSTGYSMCQVDSNGFLYAPAQVPASSTARGGVMVDSTEVDSANPAEFVKCRVDENGVLYSKGYDTAIAQLQHQGAGHDIMVSPTVASDVVTLTNNAMNYVAITGSASYTLKFPARLNPSTNARDFFVVLAFGYTWSSSDDTFSISGVTSATSGETPKVFAADGEQLTFSGISANANVMLYFTEITPGVFVVSRKTTSRIF